MATWTNSWKPICDNPNSWYIRLAKVSIKHRNASRATFSVFHVAARRALFPTNARNDMMSSLMKKLSQILFTRENLLAVLLCLILIALVIFTADTSPTWIYQGF